MAVKLKSPDTIEIMNESALMVGRTLAEVARNLKPGISLQRLNDIAEEYIADMKATPSFKGYGGFPGALCLSPNDQVVHGLPSAYEVKDGDILSIDCGVFHQGYHGDSAYTFIIGEVPEEVYNLLSRTKNALYQGIAEIKPGKRIGDISNAIQEATEKKYGYGVVRELVGHGIGRELHEEPQVPNYGRKGYGSKLKEGMVIAIEPMINLGVADIDFHQDGWTVTTRDHKVSAHYEHTVAIQDGKARILSSFEEIEKAERENPELKPVE